MPKERTHPKDARRRIYAEYDPFKAQDSINHENANKGTKPHLAKTVPGRLQIEDRPAGSRAK